MVLGITSIDIGSFFVLDKLRLVLEPYLYPKSWLDIKPSHLLIRIPNVLPPLERVGNSNTSSEALCHVRYS
jgi:hypothetical protein